MQRRPGFFAPILLCSALCLPLAAQEFDQSKWGQNSAGDELGTHEGPRQRTSSGTVLEYNLLGKGFPSNLSYTLWGWIPGHKPQKEMEGVSFDRRGLLVCSGKPGFCHGQAADDPINLKTNAVLGEPIRFGVVSNDGKVAGFAQAVPFPIEAADKKCKLSVVRQTPLAEVVLVRASGFTPYEMLTVWGQPGAEDSVHSPTAAPDGTWQAVVGIKPPGQTAGVATIKVAGKACSVAVSFPWGEGSAKPQ